MPIRKHVFTFGVPPVSIDIMLHVKGLDFKEAWSMAEWKVIDDVNVNLIDLQSLIRTKKASGRHRDMDDIENIAQNGNGFRKREGIQVGSYSLQNANCWGSLQ